MSKTKRINLIPEDKIKKKNSLSFDSILILSAFAVFCTIGILFVTGHTKKKSLAKSEKVMSIEEKEFSRKIANLSLKFIDISKPKRATLVSEVVNSRIKWSEAFKELSVIIPNKTWLTYLKAENKKGTPQITLKGEAPSQKKMARFLTALERSHHFNKTNIINSERIESYNPSLYQFHFKLNDSLWEAEDAE